ncbi:MotA/TolQ/ExbB proton channel family protein [Alteromonas sp. 009811495]|uniref:MotA/TolQ/ExbB proton channel family protein n=1 Tax=Alteromonas sp. 009811495 TaxID=3002962 RepID=UPI00237D6108|nr:MotA/TolQ/ExbB proton channel family protein [Alteromonas sp. 009811495]WDT85940.1 MotA/TolQ/ExbB proton channel family protein [Alteromonas sp. 009811495]
MSYIIKKIRSVFQTITSDSTVIRNRLFPINFVTHLLIIYFSILSGYGVYKSILVKSHDDLLNGLRTTQVVPDILKNYSTSSISIDGKTTDDKTLSNRELSELLLAAEIVESRDVTDPDAILDVENGGVGAWLATTLLNTDLQSDNLNLVDAMAGLPRVSEDSKPVAVPTLEVLVRLYRKTGFGGDGQESTFDDIDVYSEALAKSLAGMNPELCPLTVGLCGVLNKITFTSNGRDSIKNVDIASSIKNVMKDPYRHYDPALTTSSYQLAPMVFNPSGVGGVYYASSPGASALDLANQNWFIEEPSQLSEAVFRLSYLLVNELYRHDNVKDPRFIYQAFRGEIQLALFILISYLAILLIWRVIQVVVRQPTESDWVRRALIPSAVLTRGNIDIENYERELIRSRGSIDQLINVLPLIGLFGTVYGISGALPNAAAAVSGSGPAAAASVNALFEQLGLAFITTAIAVAGVIILEYCWEKIQTFEEVLIWKHLHDKENPCP